jgi:UDP-N-acetylmuramoyl-L-alanyl-D-glutamate--2,6-diaminopimelate ligase
MQKKIRSLLETIGQFELYGSPNITVRGLTSDSREVKKGFVFVAVKGLNLDGHDYINVAIDRGASVVVCEKQPKKITGVTFFKVIDSRRALGLLASAWFGYPSKKLKVIGVTGTDGKTTTCHLVYHVLNTAGKKVGLVSTILARVGNKEFDTGFHVTNPDPISLQAFLAKMVESHCEYAVVEITSHGIDQQRIAGIDFDTTVLTNITPEHLDYHKTFDSYRKTKISFLKQAKKTVVINNDDKSSKIVIKSLPGKTKTFSYGTKGRADLKASEIEDIQKGLEFNTDYGNYSIKIISNLHGKYNASNILAAVSVAKIYNLPVQSVLKAIRTFESPEGRLQEIVSGRKFKIIVDFAHTPNALLNVLTYLRKVTSGRLISVFGCAGERDKSKRREMGKISGKISDISIFTAEDPRHEKVSEIINRMSSGARFVGAVEVSQNIQLIRSGRYFIKIPDRGEAVYFAINKLARANDTIVICGKGHEKSMSYNGIEYPWSDASAVKEALNGRIFKITR